ncbi:MAG: DUF2975 domain-containing protein [Pseudomonadota bacterium]
MTSSPRNSMAAALSVLMTVVIWLTAIVGSLVFVLLLIGLFASLNSGALSLPGGDAVADISSLNFVFTLATIAVILPGIVYVCVQLRRILTTLAEGDPFVPENAQRLTRIALALGVMEIASIVFVLCMRGFIPAEDAISRPALGINFVVWAAVAALFILSQVFREGTRLREEEKMTI